MSRARPPRVKYYAYDGWSWLIYFNHWVVMLACLYFILVALLTFAAVYSRGKAASGTPLIVTITNICYGGSRLSLRRRAVSPGLTPAPSASLSTPRPPHLNPPS